MASSVGQPQGGQIIFAGEHRPSTFSTPRMLAIGAAAGLALSFIASQPVVKVAAVAAFTATKALCFAHHVAAAVVAGVIVVAALVVAVKYAQHQHVHGTLKKDFLNIARGWHEEEEVRNKQAQKEVLPIPSAPGSNTPAKQVMMHQQGIKDIRRPGGTHISIGTQQFPVPTPSANNSPAEQLKCQLKQEARIRGIFTELPHLFNNDPRLSDERAAEVVTLLLSQTVQAQLWGVLCKRLGSNYNPPQQDTSIPRTYSIQVNDRNEIVLTTEVAFKTQLIADPEDVAHHERYTIRTEMRISKEAILSKSMEELTSKEFAVSYQITKRPTQG